MSYPLLMCLMFSFLALALAVDLGFSSSGEWPLFHQETMTRRVAGILIITAFALWSGIVAFYGDDACHCSCCCSCQCHNEALK